MTSSLGTGKMELSIAMSTMTPQVTPVLDPAEPDFEKMMHEKISDFRLQISDLA